MEFRPYAYQQKAIQHILDHPAAGLFLDMGLGKTVCTLTAIKELMYGRFEVARVLVIATKRVAQTTWTEEVDKWDHLQGLKVSRVLGSAEERKDALRCDADIYVINRENVVWLTQKLKRWPFDMIVIDELSSFKSSKAKRFKALRKVRPLADRVVGLTGTPASNGYMDLWPEMYLLDCGKRLGRTITGYRERFFRPGRRNGYVVYDWILDHGADQKIMQLISDICISMKSEDYLDLPAARVNDITVHMPDAAQTKYKQMERAKILELVGHEVTAFQAATVMGKLLQMANGAVYDDEGRPVTLHDAKIEAMMDIMDAAQGQPVLCFYSYKHDLQRLHYHLRSYDPRVLEGPEDIKDWNEGRVQLLLAHPASAGHGLNLQAGGHIIVWFGLPWSLELYQQANARLHRQGQKETVIIHRLIAEGTADEIVKEKLERKDLTQEELLQALKARLNDGQKNN